MITRSRSRTVMILIILVAGPSVARGGIVVGELPIPKPTGGMPVDVNLLGDFTKNTNGKDPDSGKTWTYDGTTGALTIDNFGVSPIKKVWLNMVLLGTPPPQAPGAQFDPTLWPTLTTTQPNAKITPLAASDVFTGKFDSIFVLWTIKPCPVNETITLLFKGANLAGVRRAEVFTTCPEPGSVVLMGIGLTLSIWHCYRRGRTSPKRRV